MGRRRMMFTAGAVALGVASGALGISAASAAPKPAVGLHQHWSETGNGSWVRVGPNACANGLNQAFYNYHWNGHKGMPGDGKLGKIIARACGVNPNNQ